MLLLLLLFLLLFSFDFDFDNQPVHPRQSGAWSASLGKLYPWSCKRIKIIIIIIIVIIIIIINIIIIIIIIIIVMLCYIQVHHFHAKSSLCGFEAAIVGSVPLGGGVSSSASVEVMMMMLMVTMKLMKIIAFPSQVATYTFLEQLTGQDAASEKEKALACQVDSLFGKFK